MFDAARATLAHQGLTTWAAVFAALTAHYARAAEKPFTHVVVDEAQDLGVPELRLLAVLTPTGVDALFFAGDLGQRIFQPPFSWKALGVDVRGRSATLKVNYRTSHQIREAADRLLPDVVRDLDGREETRRGTISVFEGPTPQIEKLDDVASETALAASYIRQALADGFTPDEIGLFVRSRAELDRGRATISASGLKPVESNDAATLDCVTIGTMHLAKGLEFRAVLVLACDADVIQSAGRIATASDEADLDEVYDTERQILYVAVTRARDRLLVTGVRPVSEFLADLTDPAGA